jgi:dynein heavy chain
VKHEKAALITQMNEDKITMKELEDNLLERMSVPGMNLIEDSDLTNTLDKSKMMSAKLTERVAKAIETGKEISILREAYRRVAGRAALLYFIFVDLSKIDHMYQFSLVSFVTVFTAAMDEAEPSTNPIFRENALVDSITFKTFRWAMQGLFQRHEMIFTALLCFRILFADKQVQAVRMDEFMHLFRCPRSMAMPNPALEWLNDSSWGAAVGLQSLGAFATIAQDITMRTKLWQKWCDLEIPENEKLPLDSKNKSEFRRLLVIRALRPDRMVNALTQFTRTRLARKSLRMSSSLSSRPTRSRRRRWRCSTSSRRASTPSRTSNCSARNSASSRTRGTSSTSRSARARRRTRSTASLRARRTVVGSSARPALHGAVAGGAREVRRETADGAPLRDVPRILQGRVV